MIARVIPPFTISGVLPPFTGANPADRPQCSPYSAEISEVVARFATTPERTTLLRGLIDLRAALHTLGVSQGTQWLDGSFVEDIETLESRPPGDIDVVTFAARPVSDPVQWRAMIAANLNVFKSQVCKQAFGCDHYFIDITKPVEIVISDTTYFSGLFSHRRRNATWKGMVSVPLNSDDAVASLML